MANKEQAKQLPRWPKKIVFTVQGDDVKLFPEGGYINLSHMARVEGARKQYFDLVPNYVEGFKAS